MFVVGILRKKVSNRDKALAYLTFTMGWTFAVFGVALMFEPQDGKPSDVLFYTAILPVFAATIWIVKSIK